MKIKKNTSLDYNHINFKLKPNFLRQSYTIMREVSFMRVNIALSSGWLTAMKTGVVQLYIAETILCLRGVSSHLLLAVSPIRPTLPSKPTLPKWLLRNRLCWGSFHISTFWIFILRLIRNKKIKQFYKQYSNVMNSSPIINRKYWIFSSSIECFLFAISLYCLSEALGKLVLCKMWY